MITAATLVEELVDNYPGAVKFLIGKQLPCIVCGEPIWGTVHDLAASKGWSDQEIETLVEEMNSTVTMKPKEATE